jgi:ribosomal-protein-alanine N-acetyltransferase
MKKLSISTNRLLIRNLALNDLDNFHSYRSNPEVTKYQGFDVMTKEECSGFIKTQENKLFGKPGEWVQYGIEDHAGRQLIGDCAIKLDGQDARLAEIGITISHVHQQKGYAKEVMTGILTFLFETEHIHRVTEIVDAENVASINLLKGLGFRQEGHFIENIFFKGQWGSEYQYAMLAREWKA